ncbi:MAG: di-trans,poly-cis-decaprenylcistransferase [Bacteroidales bacterium]|nr:di-trans,poly-cis-decaprenylcistransferase [Bacteroidales bacterium]
MEKKIPQHVSIIMDGNGRWAEERGRERTFGHYNGVGSVRAVTEACARAGVKYLSLYSFSEENWNRPKEEVSYLMSLMAKAMMDEVENLLKNGIRLVVLGNLDRIDKDLVDSIHRIEEMTAQGKNLTLVIFLSYSGKWDILQAIKRLAASKTPEQIQAMDIKDFDQWLVTAGIPDPDLIIRTSGEQRISNYLLWQGAYSEFYFTPVLWPDFREKELHQALEEYALRDRRYGKVK